MSWFKGGKDPNRGAGGKSWGNPASSSSSSDPNTAGWGPTSTTSESDSAGGFDRSNWTWSSGSSQGDSWAPDPARQDTDGTPGRDPWGNPDRAVDTGYGQDDDGE